MIKINLATRKQQSIVAASGPQKLDFQSVVEQFKEFFGDLPVGQYAAALILCAVATYGWDWQESQELQKVDAQIEQASAERDKLQAQLGKTKGYEELKRAMDSDEVVIRTKIETIEKLIEGRQTSPALLIALSSAVPPEVWLAELALKEGGFGIKGSSIDYNQISDFMRNLGESAYFTDINLSSSKQVRDETGQVVASFELSARRR